MAKVNLDVKVNADMKIKLRFMGEALSVGYADVVRNALSKAIQDFEKVNKKINVDEIRNQQILFGSEKK